MYMRSGRIAATLLMLFLGMGLGASAQTWGEWFRQRHTQKKYLLEQIAALQVYTDYVRKGYGIASDGLGMVRDITNGEFRLHDLFITGLKKASPAVRNDVRVAEIAAMQISIVRIFANLLDLQGLSAERLHYLQSVRAAVTEDCLSDIAELLLVTTSGKVEMGDSERLSRLEAIYQRMQDKSAFVQGFSQKVVQFSKQIYAENSGVKQLGGWYGVH